ncbi:MAG: DEAD/DEAH box helicase [Chloroflexi bacterium]|nr:DEAD/DEAH box helicase [Chloroflexota bacterium]
MNHSDFNHLCNEVLSLIELEETKLLGWGFVNIRVDLRRDLLDMLSKLPATAVALWNKAQQTNYTEQDIIENLIERRLLFEVPDGYRSRFAETVRLLFLLRQRFSNDDWQVAPHLVSDFKLKLQPRRYPRRNITLEQLREALKPLRPSQLFEDSIATLLQGTSTQSLQLSQFQLDAIIQQIRNLQANNDQALVIGAGTGAGKTKAFYLPALAYIAENIQSDYATTQVLALYPRTELLKDQLAEAFSEARKLDSLLSKAGKRQISLGAYYGDTPSRAADFSSPHKPNGWKQADDLRGWICPYFTCPNELCNHAEMIWLQQDIDREAVANRSNTFGEHTRLQCRKECGFETDAGQLMLTREQMIKHPPDILFTTTEMLNRRLSRVAEHSLFGVNANNPPRLVLLDEIHTYEGISGAQVAYLLRRWRQARGTHGPQRSLCLVGLSATLTQAETFFAKLVGLPARSVQYIEPHENDLITEGMEYNIVLRGDPVSGTSLLSTSVQTAMLLGRALDNGDNPVSQGAFGSKTFAFTDKLDVINRWYYIQYDAEYNKRLSRWRKLPEPPDNQRRERMDLGQIWPMSERIGHDLEVALRLGRTTSQDRGFNTDAELVIATSTLEVGFNDPNVGAVIQHKAPRSMASFLQRKGRAGRQRGMRPWLALVVSAYGRDRWAFQHAEEVFDPRLATIHLPLENYYVQKIQAAFALLDWLALVLKKQGFDADVWKSLSSAPYSSSSWFSGQRKAMAAILRDLLNGKRLEEFTAYLTQALVLQHDETAVTSILWGEPRSLLYHVIPTILRQLETDWQAINRGNPQKWADNIAAMPLPAFVPSALFNDLNVPEVQIFVPTERWQSDETREEMLGLAQSLIEFAPGRANKRFALTHHADLAHWLQIPDPAPDAPHNLNIHALKAEFDPVPSSITVSDTSYLVYRPRAYHLNAVPDDVRTTSYSQLQWLSHFQPRSISTNANQSALAAQRQALAVFSSNSQWQRFFYKVESFTQSSGEWVEVARLAVGVQVDTRYKNGSSSRYTLQFSNGQGMLAAIGFSVAADALKFSFYPLDVSALFAHPRWPTLYQNLSPHYFLHLLQQDQRVSNLSSFEIEWLWQIELSMLTTVAISRSCSLPEAAQEVQENRHALANHALNIIFQSQAIDEIGDSIMTGKLHKQLLDHQVNPDVQAALSAAATALWHPNQQDLAEWLSGCYASSLGAVLFTAVIQLLPDIEPNDLHMDIAGGCIWISEAITGGVGLISKIVTAITQHPRQFELQLLDTLAHCRRSQLAQQLRAVVQLIQEQNPELEAVFAQVRQESDLSSLTNAQKRLTHILEAHGIPPTRQLFVALNNKILRANSDADTDKLIADLAHHWEAEENRLGIAIDLRVIAVAGYQIPTIQEQVKKVLNRIGGGQPVQDETQVFNLLQSLLWLNCVDSCPDCIQTWNPYQPQIRPSRDLLTLLLAPYGQTILYGDAYWESQLQKALVAEYQAELLCEQAELAECKIALLHALTQPIDIGFQSFYPVIESIRQDKQQWRFHLIIRELVGE